MHIAPHVQGVHVCPPCVRSLPANHPSSSGWLGVCGHRSARVAVCRFVPNAVARHFSMSVSLPDLIRAIRGQIPNEKCDLLEELVQKLQRREVRLNRQEFLHKVRDIAGDDAPALRSALKQLALDRKGGADGMLGGGGDLGGSGDASVMLLGVGPSDGGGAPSDASRLPPPPEGATVGVVPAASLGGAPPADATTASTMPTSAKCDPADGGAPSSAAASGTACGACSLGSSEAKPSLTEEGGLTQAVTGASSSAPAGDASRAAGAPAAAQQQVPAVLGLEHTHACLHA